VLLLFLRLLCSVACTWRPWNCFIELLPYARLTRRDSYSHTSYRWWWCCCCCAATAFTRTASLSHCLSTRPIPAGQTQPESMQISGSRYRKHSSRAALQPLQQLVLVLALLSACSLTLANAEELDSKPTIDYSRSSVSCAYHLAATSCCISIQANAA
jgi:hypothetical protein